MSRELMWQLLFNGIASGATYALLGLGFGLIYSLCRFFHFSHGLTFTIAPLMTLVLVEKFYLNFYVAILLSILMSAFAGLFFNYAVYSPIRRLNGNSLILFLASMGLYTLGYNALFSIFGPEAQPLLRSIHPVYSVLGARIGLVRVVTFGFSIAWTVALWLFLKNSQLGKIIRAISDDPELASIIGVNLERTESFVFFVGSFLAGFAGVLIGLDSGAYPAMGFNVLFVAVVTMAVGGIGNPLGTLLAGISVGIVQNLSAAVLPSHFQDTALYIFALTLLLMRPRGLMTNAL